MRKQSYMRHRLVQSLKAGCGGARNEDPGRCSNVASPVLVCKTKCTFCDKKEGTGEVAVLLLFPSEV